MTAHFSLSGQVAVITGGNSGIGLKTAERFIAAGASVIVADIAENLAIEQNDTLRYVPCDVRHEGDVINAMATAIEAFGQVDILVNNAGTFSGYENLQEKTADAFRNCFEVNVLGVANGMRAAAQVMRSGGSIVNTASAAGLIGVAGLGDYAASKHAVVGLTKSAALEFASQNIRVNCVCPTTVNTPMAHAAGGEHLVDAERVLVPLGRICEPEEVAALIHFLASEDCRFINGQAIALDGGMSAGSSEQLFEKLTT